MLRLLILNVLKKFGAATVIAAFVSAASPSPGAPVFPLKKSANGRYLVDQNNVPVMIMGDSPQALVVNISEVEADGFFANRQSHGYNTLWINLLCATYTGRL